MRYNPKTLRWEGNESALQAFEGLSSSARPLLITHHTATRSSTSLSSFANDPPATPSRAHGGTATLPGSPVSAAISLTAKVVGNMWFDPERMKWIHMGGNSGDPAADEEEDVFAGMDDEDEDEEALGLEGGNKGGGSVAEREEKRSSSRARRIRESGASSSSGALTPMDLDDRFSGDDEGGAELALERKQREKEFARACRLAEEGHRAEVAGWGLGVKVSSKREEVRLWEIRKVALRTGK